MSKNIIESQNYLVMKYYSQLTYWKNYLPFIPEKYRAGFVEPKEAYWKWRGFDFHYDYALSEGSRLSVVLLHGAGGNGRIMSILGNTLGRFGHNYFAPDNLGFGLTQLNGQSYWGVFGGLGLVGCTFNHKGTIGHKVWGDVLFNHKGTKPSGMYF